MTVGFEVVRRKYDYRFEFLGFVHHSIFYHRVLLVREREFIIQSNRLVKKIGRPTNKFCEKKKNLSAEPFTERYLLNKDNAFEQPVENKVEVDDWELGLKNNFRFQNLFGDLEDEPGHEQQHGRDTELKLDPVVGSRHWQYGDDDDEQQALPHSNNMLQLDELSSTPTAVLDISIKPIYRPFGRNPTN